MTGKLNPNVRVSILSTSGLDFQFLPHWTFYGRHRTSNWTLKDSITTEGMAAVRSKEEYSAVTADSGHGQLGDGNPDPSRQWTLEDMSKTLCWLSKHKRCKKIVCINKYQMIYSQISLRLIAIDLEYS